VVTAKRYGLGRRRNGGVMVHLAASASRPEQSSVRASSLALHTALAVDAFAHATRVSERHSLSGAFGRRADRIGNCMFFLLLVITR
jgi:hypothetical protein